MKQITLLICILFLVTSCEIQYDGETKIAVTGKLIDENGIPIASKDIQIDVLDGPGLIFSGSDLISYGKSDQNGNFTLLFPAPRDGNRISISINDIINSFNEYQSKNIIFNKKNLENYKLDLNNLILYKNESITTLRLILNPTSPSKQIKDIQIEGKQPNSRIDLVLYPTLNNDPIINTSYHVIKNQTIVLKYTIIDYSNNGATTAQSISIPIANDAVTYTITY
jgi:hypothetical protein